MLDLVAAHLLHIAFVQKTDIHIALGQFVAQDVVNLRQLKIAVADQRDFLVLEFDGGRRAFEIKTGGDFLGRVLDAVFHFHHIGFTDSIKRGHGRYFRSSGATILT